ncbi:hypothetical protein JKP75_12925 [Blastococcus sp. TML/M2B]|uniref:hypothetical protein n=1 Tax=unclassified Blastococcus TaxID=2619396 RepID=UPI00190A0721|nr:MULTISPECIES: hypothetical protein [unclassified Blastococcus]MBN1093385.1 hypothetical protein [Blastococcus sp. TML/M2B]MBN1096497.1 hypothetical protein [Blastococcus sp. TML/C7B]
MATIEISADTVRVALSRSEKFFGLLRDLEVPRSAVTAAEAVPSGLGAVRGLRAPGLGLPGVRAIGTWRARGEKSFVSVRRGQPALRLRLTGRRYDTVLIGTDAAAELAARLAPGVPRHG